MTQESFKERLHIFCIPSSLKWSLPFYPSCYSWLVVWLGFLILFLFTFLFFALLFKQNSLVLFILATIPGRASLTLLQVLSGPGGRVPQFAVEGGALRAAAGRGQDRNALVERTCLSLSYL